MTEPTDVSDGRYGEHGVYCQGLGTNSYLLGDGGDHLVNDPGPVDSEHLEAEGRAVQREGIWASLGP